MRKNCCRTGKMSLQEKNDEKNLIVRAQRKDGGAFGELYGLHQTRVYNLCLRMVASVEDAEDMTQETFIQAWKKIDTFQCKSLFTTWLHRIAVNIILMKFRKKDVMKKIESLDEPNENPKGEETKKEIPYRDATLMSTIDRAILEKAIENLPPDIALCLFSTMLRDTNIMKSQSWWDARLVPPKANFIKRVRRYATT